MRVHLLTTTMLLLIALVICCGESDNEKWQRKDAYRFCADAIETYPSTPAPPCNAMHMCINEASLTENQRLKLLQMIRSTKDCPEP